MNWGKSIVAAFIFFAAFIATLVTICVRQDTSLVSGSYYKDELVYQDQMNRIQNVSKLATKPEIVVGDNTLELQFADLAAVENGELKLFRPSNAAFDKTFKVDRPDGDKLSFDLGGIPGGMYRVKFQWKMNGEEYYHEEVIYL